MEDDRHHWQEGILVHQIACSIMCIATSLDERHAVAGEENVLMEDDRHYWQESILVHEFAHSIMCIGMDQEQRCSIEAAYGEAKAAGLYQSHIYMMANADEYWAEATQSWFDATVRTGQ